jgi:bicarbonate transport system ATP-binding protein
MSPTKGSPFSCSMGSPFNGEDPLAYLNSLAIKHDIYVAEVALDRRPVLL